MHTLPYHKQAAYDEHERDNGQVDKLVVAVAKVQDTESCCGGPETHENRQVVTLAGAELDFLGATQEYVEYRAGHKDTGCSKKEGHVHELLELVSHCVSYECTGDHTKKCRC